MNEHAPLPPESLCRRSDPDSLGFQTTESLEPLRGRLGQARAAQALQFGLGMSHEGYNLYAMGPTEAGKYTAVRALLDARAASESVPDDVCYVSNFERPHQPRALRLPSSRGREFRKDVHQLIDELRTAIPGALDTDEFRARKQAIEDELKERHENALEDLRRRASQREIALVRTPAGLTLAPVRGGDVLPPEVFAKLPDEERAKIEKDLEGMEEVLRNHVENTPRWEAEARRKMKEIARTTLLIAVGHLIDALRIKYDAIPDVVAYLTTLQQDVIDNAGAFMKNDEWASPASMEIGAPAESPLRRYHVNLLVDHSETKGAPVVYEDHPLFDNLIGRIEHLSQMGALITDFTLVKAGALHRANGGYLVLDTRNLLLEPYAWDGLKRALFAKQIRITSVPQLLGLASTVSLEPEPIPLNVKVILLGERRLFYLLEQLDPDFHALFKVAVDFDDEIDRTAESNTLFARLIAGVVRDAKLRHLDAPAVARALEQSARLAGDAGKLSAHMGTLLDLTREADHAAAQAPSTVVRREHVDKAIEAQERRAGRIRERVLEEIHDGTLLIETAGARVGQVNGLSVMQLGTLMFGRPSRITARVRLGRGEVIDVEREVELGGPIHSKGVMILAGYLGSRYAPHYPLSLAATLVFEQSYGMVEGDSASCAELYAIVSALSEVPIKQSIAVTGSVNQHGEVQAIGGVNEKIEGFFDVCRARGLDGSHGAMIPESNVRHLMLRSDVVQAARDGKFHIWAVRTVDQGIEILTGMQAGERDNSGYFPAETINGKAEARLVSMAKQRVDFAASGGRKEG